MTKVDASSFSDIFYISRPKKQPKPRQYRATWPCGSTWDFDRFDLEIPMYKDGEQTGVTHCYDSLREALAYLPSDAGCTVERLS